ncbi:hypothetical protein DRO97_02630 [Archaeoglobales archaeon]|nr:MAG: hypothetical protein DRO97_02630 [Archaeoglobales archaeon]
MKVFENEDGKIIVELSKSEASMLERWLRRMRDVEQTVKGVLHKSTSEEELIDNLKYELEGLTMGYQPI